MLAVFCIFSHYGRYFDVMIPFLLNFMELICSHSPIFPIFFREACLDPFVSQFSDG